MDARAIIQIVKDYEAKRTSFADASLALVVLGCGPTEVARLLQVRL